MTTITITHEPAGGSALPFRASDGVHQSVGQTVGAALDALSDAIGDDESSAVVIVQRFRPDSLFTAEQQHRLRHLQGKRSQFPGVGSGWSAADQAELERLVAFELRASAERSGGIADELGR